MTKKHVRNDGNYFTDAELTHRLVPPQVRRSPDVQHKLRQKKGRNRPFFWCGGTRKYNRPVADGTLYARFKLTAVRSLAMFGLSVHRFDPVLTIIVSGSLLLSVIMIWSY